MQSYVLIGKKWQHHPSNMIWWWKITKEIYNKSDSSSPTVSLEMLMMSCTIGMKEIRYVVVTDIPGAFLHADMEEEVHMLLDGTIAELIVKLDPKQYRKYIWRKKRQTYFVCETKEGPIWNTSSSIIVWRLLSDTLKEWGFKLHEYDKFMANKTINEWQSNIIWHVDDLKKLHKNEKVVEDIFTQLKKQIQKRKSSHHHMRCSIIVPWDDVGILDKW